MKKMRPQSTQRCSYCTVRANWRSQHLNQQKYACDAHREQLQAHEAKNRDDGYMTEADHQTWGRL